LEAGGHGLDAARNALSFLLVADADEFLTVAKFRALRRLWARVEEACGLAPKPLRLHAETAWRMTARRDPWVNLLRGTIAAFSAGIGGADTLLVQPFTAALGLPDAFARRVARNTQHILLEESNLWRVADPAAGAGGFEALTHELCGTAWALFQEIEREGGVVASLTAGALQARIAAVRERRERAVATRKDPITGVSEFPNIHEAPVSVLMPHAPEVEAPEPGPGVPASAAPITAFSSLVEALANGATTGDIAAASGAAPLRLVPLPSSRTAEPFERLRDRSDDHLARTGERPKVFLANLGPVAAFTARATFAKNFFEAGGIEAITNDGFEDVDALVNACSGSKARLFCVCSSDEIYKERAEEVILGLRNVSKSPIYIACRPGELEEKIRRAGATTFIFAGCDALTVLGEALSAASA
jgi:methylmalonyl-CoA mutase